MKKILSILCVLSLIMSIAIIPAAFNVSAENVDGDIAPSATFGVTVLTEDDETVYRSGTWDRGSLTFDYVIESGYSYVFEFDYMGHNWKSGADDRTAAAFTVATPETTVNNNNATAVSLNVPSSKTAWTHVARVLSGDALLECGGTYLCVNWSGLDPAANFKNFKIHKVDAATVAPVKSRNLTAYLEDGECAFQCDNYNVNSIVYDKVIEADKKYVLVYDYMMNTAQFDKQAPSATTVADTNSLPANDVVSGAVNIGIPQKGNVASADWKTMATVLDGNAVRSATDGDYLAIHWMWKNSGEFWIKNVKVYDYVPTALNYTKLNKVSTDYCEDGMIYNANGYDAHCITFDYEIEADKEYYLTFDYKGNGQSTYNGGSAGFASQAPAAGTISDFNNAYNGDINGEINLNVPNSLNAYTSVLAKLNGNDLLAVGGKYLTISWIFAVDSNPISFKNFQICEVADADMDVPSFTHNMSKSVDNGSIVYSNKDYNAHSLVFDKVVQDDKVYQINFDYMGHNASDIKNIADMKCVPAVSAIAGPDTKINDMSKLLFLPLGVESHKTEWKHYAPVFTGNELFSTGGDYISIQCMWVGPDATANFKNIKIEAYDFGDVNFDNEINGSDITALKKVLLGAEEDSAKFTNINEDEATDIRDLVAIKKIVA